MTIDSQLDRMAAEDEKNWVRETVGPRGLYTTVTPVSDSPYEEDPERLPATHDNAVLVGSKLPNGNHMPVIDLDLPCTLVPSSTPGHFHLYINKEMTFGQMLNMLQMMTDAGVVQPGFNRFSRERGQAFVRYPGVTRNNEAARIEEGLAAAEQAELARERELDFL